MAAHDRPERSSGAGPATAAGAVSVPVLVVVPTLDEAASVRRVVAQLLDGAPAGAILAIADGGSTDGTREAAADIAARDPRVRLVANPARIQSAGVNRAVAALGAECGVLVRADAHCDYPPGFVATLLDEAERTGAAAVAVALETVGAGGFAAGVAAAQNGFIGTGGAAHRVGAGGRWVDHGHHALMRLDAFREVGGYDESFRHNEDAELDHRLGRAGHRVWLTGRTRARYHPRKTPGALFRQYAGYGRGRAAMLWKHRLRPRARQAAPLAVPGAMALALAGAALAAAGGGAPALVLALPLAGWAGLCLAAGAVMAARARRAAVLWAGPAAMIMHTAWAFGFLRGLARETAARRMPADGREDLRHGG